MANFKVLICGLICGVCWRLSLVESKQGYMLTLPQELNIGSHEKLCIHFYNVSANVDVYLNISCYGRSYRHHPKTFNRGESGCFVWELPKTLTPGTCDLDLEGEEVEGDYTFSERREVKVVDKHQITFIQMDKPVYKPGEIVKMRVLTVTQDLKPLKADVELVTVDDPQGFHMRQWTEIKAQAGLVSLDYRLYDEPELGTWKVVVVVDGRKTEKTFEVQQYVLPKFQVYMKLPTTLTVATEAVQLEICAKYTFGKPVIGSVNASVCLVNTETSWFCEKNLRPCAHLTAKLNGCHNFIMETKLLNLTARQFSLLCKPLLTVQANVTEKETGAVVEATQQGSGVWEERVKLKFISKKYFKPFFPYRGQLYAWKPDGSPAVNEEITLTIGKLGIERTVVTDSTGHVKFNIKMLTHSTPYFILNAKTKDQEVTDTKLYTIYPAATRMHVKQWYSPTSSYVQLSTIYKGQRRCGDTIEIDVVYSLLSNITVKSAAAQVMAQGNILQSTDMTWDMSRSSPYLPHLDGPVWTPVIVQSPVIDDIEFIEDSNKLQPGPSQFPAGPPGSRWAQQAGPPGSPQGSEKVPAAPLESLGIGETEEETKINPDRSSTVFTKVTPPSLRHFSLRQYISMEMSPMFRVLVYMVTDSGELVADTIDIEVQHCYENKVNLSFKQKSARPGELVDLTLTAKPGSLCTTGMVDKAVYLHAGNLNFLQPSQIDEQLKAYDLTSDFINDWQYCSDRTILPPNFISAGSRISAVGAPGYDDETVYLQAPFRKRRSIMQYYSNMYDALLAFKVAGLTVLTDLDLQTRPCLHDGDLLGPPYLPGDPRGPIPGPGGELHALEPTDEPVDRRDPISSLRRNFPETWLWELYEVPSSGRVTFSETMPDSITEWIGNSVCTNEKSGLGVSDIARVTSFQPFFADVKLPYSVIRGEVVNIDVMVYNYLSHCTAIQLSIVQNDKFELLEGDNEAQTCICKEQSDSYTFQIRPTQLGKHTITFSAYLKEHRESCYSTKTPPGYKNKHVTELVVRELNVQAEGVEEETTTSQFICPQVNSSDGFVKSYTPELPTDMLVNGSLRGWVSVMGDIMGPVLSGLEDLILLPAGCGEQNMVRLGPNIAILQYLTLTRQLTDDIRIKAIDHLNKGYQQQLKFMHKDGSYSAFGTADDKGSTWLSAFVFKTFQRAMDYIYVDRKQILIKTWEFLINQQGEDGCFNENGKVLSKYMMGGVAGSSGDRKRALTAYVLVSMLESFKMMKERTPPFVALAVRCIQIDNLEDTYTHALVAYAMALYKPHSRFTEIILDRLLKKATVQGSTLHWRRGKEPEIFSGQGRAASAEIEITSYALLALMTRDPDAAISDLMPIVHWLTSQRNAYGGFASTQDTVVALQALSLFAQRIYGGGLDVNINIADERGTSKDIHVTQGNSLIKQQIELSNPGARLHITAKGEGCVLMQTTYRYHVQNKLVSNDMFTLTVTTPVRPETIRNNCRQRTLKVCASYNGADDVSNMVVVEVKMMSGWIADVASLQVLVNSVETGLKKYEMDKRYSDVVNFYFDQLSSASLCFEFNINQEVDVSKQQPAMARVFDYYETSYETTVFYELTPCIEEYVEQVDISIDGDADFLVETPGILTLDHNHLHSESVSKPHGMTSENHPGPKVGPQCPMCHFTGTVNVLENICKKQVWILAPVNGFEFSLWVLASEGVSPELSMELPNKLSLCPDCEAFLTQSGEKSMVFLEPTDWNNLAANIAQSGTVIIPWSEHLQTSIHGVLQSCVYK